MTQGLPTGIDPTAGADTGDPNPLDQPEAWDVVVLDGQPSPGPPGWAVVSGASAPRKLDIKDGQGQSGATVTYKGEKLSQFTVTIYLIETSDWVAWFKWRKLLARPPAAPAASGGGGAAAAVASINAGATAAAAAAANAASAANPTDPKLAVAAIQATTSAALAANAARTNAAMAPAAPQPKALTIYHPALSALGITSVLIEEEGQPEPEGETGLYKVPIKMVQWKKPTPTLGTPAGSSSGGAGPTPQDAAEGTIAGLQAQVRGLAG
jgi:hypothetical protein